MARYLVESQIGYIQIWIQFGIHAASRPATPALRFAGWAGNPKGSQITPFCHQMGRHPTIWDTRTGIRRRIPAQISLWGSQDLNPSFFSPILDSKDAKMQISCRVSNLCGTHRDRFGAPWGPRGRHWAHPPAGSGLSQNKSSAWFIFTAPSEVAAQNGERYTNGSEGLFYNIP